MSEVVLGGDAVLSKGGKYRYTLDRTWSVNGGRLLFVGLNPSTADAKTNDPTTRRMLSRAADMGFGSYRAVNLFAYRSCDPKELKKVYDPVGPDNDEWIIRSAEESGAIILGWGHGGSYLDRDAQVLFLLQAHDLLCLGKTQGGQPRHPLYLPASAETVEFP